MEEDENLDLKFNDDSHTQPYLSLGLTPLSQLSPTDLGEAPSSGADSYFFPSMPPPVNPISSVFSLTASSPSHGIPVDSGSAFNISNGVMVMPEANPTASTDSILGGGVARRGMRKSKHEVGALSQGYGMKLEPVPEQSCSLDDSFGDLGFGNPPKNIPNGIISSSSSSAEDSSNLLPIKLLKEPVLSRKTGKRRKSGTRRRMEEGWDDGEEMMVLDNKNVSDPFESPPVRLSLGLKNTNIEASSPRQQGRKVRQEMRDKELIRQKGQLRQKILEEEQSRLMRRDQRAAKIVQDYGSTKQHAQPDSPYAPGLVLQEAMRYEAQMQLMEEGTNQNIVPNDIVNTSNQFSVL